MPNVLPADGSYPLIVASVEISPAPPNVMPVVTATCPNRLNQPVSPSDVRSWAAIVENHTCHPRGKGCPFLRCQNCCPEVWTPRRRYSTNNLCHSETDEYGEEADDKPNTTRDDQQATFSGQIRVLQPPKASPSSPTASKATCGRLLELIKRE